jgi:hypothetical protein
MKTFFSWFRILHFVLKLKSLQIRVKTCCLTHKIEILSVVMYERAGREQRTSNDNTVKAATIPR